MPIDSYAHEMVLQVDVESPLGGSSNLYHIEERLLTSEFRGGYGPCPATCTAPPLKYTATYGLPRPYVCLSQPGTAPTPPQFAG
jgi:hypothetical protein